MSEASENLFFASTGPLQDLAISRGWSDQYLSLSEEFDRLVE